ncbi:MAG: peptidyl-prolyl cis-trans isomerase [Thermoleophilaceae bacterium]
MPTTQTILHALRRPRAVLLTLPVIAAGAIVAGCGNDVPPNAVAKVNDQVITKDEFNRFFATAAKGQSQSQGGAASVTPDPPNFTKCIAAGQQQAAPPGTPKPTSEQLKAQCKQQYDATKDQVMQFLIQAEWIQQEAAERDVKVSDAEVKKQFEDQKKQSFPKEKDYQKFLKESGMTEADILFQVKLDVLQNKLREKILEGEGKATDEEIQEYYDKNKKRFSQPERRDLLVVLTKTKAKAEQAKRALERGQSFKSVAKRYSTDSASKKQGGKLPDVAKGQQEKALDEAAFSAPKGKLSGPVKTQFGWYVFEVSKISPATQQSLEEAKKTITQVLRSEGEQKAVDDFVKDFQDKYKEETHCAKDYVVQECENAPKEDKSAPEQGAPGQPGAPPSGGAPPQGGAPQGAVPQGGAPPGAVPQGGAPQGAPPGAVPQGAPPSGAPPQGAPPQAPPGG